MKKVNSKIPGILPPPPKTEVDGKITDLSSKSLSELHELKERQVKLLNNKYFISKLPDKGSKIQTFHDKIVNEIKAKQEELDTCHMFNKLNLNDVDKQMVQEVEWTGKLEKNNNTVLDSDDDSEPEDILHLLSQNTAKEKKLKVVKPDKPLVSPEDLIKIGELPHVKYIVDKTEHNPTPKVTGQFKPYKTTKSDVHNPEKEINRIRSKKWEVTAATPPPIVHGPAKVLSIEDSLKLQQDYNLRLKEINAQHAAEKLTALEGIKMEKLPEDTSKFGTYREADSDDSEADPEGSDLDVHDEEPERGGVVFTVMK
ncbi:DNA-directed RNA polymerase II subunit GRINL1A [Manduca sexta]|uniref:DNA-directed RNA polymerase II subunit GRINL1A n=1 Tax=Manduca sexta TaxID=7130 RepID=UPI00188E29C2|nr:DNA-directed RNA polymerase II subunit GRINL1A [Manduca sexta]